ncbi:hypothetical protein [Polaromonas sp. AET17H-212]|uniref:hypothetical protein n=1 Tax=Polaromonas sp. AET17H-212 TaxID=1977061 RepID=UPI001142AB17|nr:hypothetical protein [Polaromonas sp. AET17H-212]
MPTQLDQFCLPLSAICRSMADWKDFSAIAGTAVAVVTAGVALWKTFTEIRKNREQREAELRLKRTEFTLAQHRRLFDDPVLSKVLRLIDGDSSALADPSMWDPKRKYLTFIEELCLLIKAGYIKKNVALYLFGYYAEAAFGGKNFRTGMAWEARYWGLFFGFAEEAREFLRQAADGKPINFEEMGI